MLEGYKKQCENFVKQWLKDNTSYNANVVLLDYEDWEENFEVSVVHKLGFKLSEKTVAGKKSIYGGKVYLREVEYKDAIEKLGTEEFINERTFRALSTHAQKAQYGEMETTVRRITTDISYGRECQKCWGKGQCQCRECSGGGSMPCNRCNGSGKVYADSTYKLCNRCSGRGMTNCSYCSGRGWAKCTDCNGEGHLVDTAVFEFRDEPLYYISSKIDNRAEKALSRIGAENFDIIVSKIELKSFKDKFDEREIIKTYKLNVPFAKFNLTINDEKYQWFVYGKTIQVYENGNILKALLDNNVKALERLSKKAWFMPMLIQNKAVKNITNAKFVRDIAKNGNFEKDKNSLKINRENNKKMTNNELFDWQFIQIIFASLHRIVNIYFTRVYILWLCLAIITSLCVLKVTDSIIISFFTLLVSMFLFLGICTWIHTTIALKLCWGKDLQYWAKRYCKRNIIQKALDFILEHWILSTVITLIVLTIVSLAFNSALTLF